MNLYSINANLINTIKSLYDNASSAVYLNNNIGDWFRTTVGVRQGCLLSPTLFNIFLERIMEEALENHAGSVSIGGRKITNLRFADDIDGLAGSEEELRNLVSNLDEKCEAAGMEISAEKTKLMTNKEKGLSSDILVNNNKLEVVSTFKYLGAIISDEGSKKEVICRIAQATAALTKLSTIWKDKEISLSTKIRLMRSLVTSIFLYACESWTLNKYIERRIQAFEMRCYRRILGITYKDRVTNIQVVEKVRAAAGPFVELLRVVKKRKLKWFGHVTRGTGLSKTILQGTVPGKRGRGRPRRTWTDNIRDWTGLEGDALLRRAENRKEWRKLAYVASAVPQRPIRLRDR